MESQSIDFKVNSPPANPAPLGLLGFGMTTILLNLHNAGFYPLGSMILAMGLAYGGLAQIIAGIMEYQRGNTFSTVAFSSYGLFWLSLVLLILLPQMRIWNLSTGLGIQVPTSEAMAAYFFMWGTFTFLMFFGTLKSNHATQFVFFTLAILFFLLAGKEMVPNTTLGIIAGYEGIICGFSAFYLAIAEVLNEAYKKTLLPV